MKRSSTVQNRQTVSGYLTTLYIRHDAAASHYRDIAQAMDSERTMFTLTSSLANYHADRTEFLKGLVDDMPSIPVKPNTDMTKEVEDVQPKEMDNDISLLKNYYAREEAMLDLYTKMLDDDGIPKELYDQLQEVSERTQEVVRKLQRTTSSGAVEKDMTV